MALMTTRALAIGKFDALHLGHRALAQTAATYGPPALLTFTGMASVLGWATRAPLVALSDRNRILAQWGSEIGADIELVQLPFAEIQPLPCELFLDILQQRFSAQAVIVGEDFRCGRGRLSGVDDLRAFAQQRNIVVGVVAPVRHGSVAISSSRVREALAAGDVALTRQLLGRPHRLVGRVVRGDGRGRQLGFPTANCAQRENQEPASGVYAAMAEVDGLRIPAAVNIGHLPTVGAGRQLSVEAHLIHVERDCYNQRMTLDFIARVRDEQRFAGLKELCAQIAQDVDKARVLLANER